MAAAAAAPRNTKDTKNGHGKAVCPSPLPSASIESASLMRPVPNSTSWKRRLSEPDNDLTALQPRRKSARLQAGIRTPKQSPNTHHPAVQRLDRSLTSSKPNTSEAKEPETRKIYRQPLARSPPSRKNTASRGHIFKDKNSDRARLRSPQQDTRQKSALLHNPPSSTSVGAAHWGESTSKREAEQPVTKRSISGKSCAQVNTAARRSGKRYRPHEEEKEPESALGAKGVREEPQPSIRSTIAFNDNSLVTDWVLNHSWSHQSSVVDQIPDLPATMSPKPQLTLPSPTFTGPASSSRRSSRSAASVHDSDYRQSMRNRNIFVEREDAPIALVQRAQCIMSRDRDSPEMDDIAIQALRNKSRRLQEDAEEVIMQQLAPDIIQAMNGTSDPRVARNAGQPWSNSVPVPLDQDVLTAPRPLPKPMPDLAFGYSEDAFTHKQLGTIDLLVDDRSGRSYAVPDQKLRFPFFAVEFKSQAKHGTHYMATNQVAGAGAIAMNGMFELMQRSFGHSVCRYDYDEPQFFSVTMDHQLACVNVHWLKAPSTNSQHSFHMEGLSKYLLDDSASIRKIIRAIKNILDYNADTRLRNLRGALDAYRDIVTRDREAANTRSRQLHELPSMTPDRSSGRTRTKLTGRIHPPEIQQHDSSSLSRALSPRLPAAEYAEQKEPPATVAAATKRRCQVPRDAIPCNAKAGADVSPHQIRPLSVEREVDVDAVQAKHKSRSV